MPQLSTSVENVFKEKNQVTLSHLKQYLVEIFLSHLSPWKCKLGPSFPTYSILSVRHFYPENEEASFLPSFHLTHSVYTHGPWLKVTSGTNLGTYHSWRLSKPTHPDGILWKKMFQVSFSLPFLSQLKVKQLIQNYREADNKILLWIYGELSQPWWKKKKESSRLPASLMLRTLKYTKSKLKYMKLSESVVKRK